MMKKRAEILSIAVLIALSFLAVEAQTARRAEIKLTDAYVKTIDAFVKKQKKPHLIFADAADGYELEAKPDWRRFASLAALEKFRETTETYTVAYNWQQKGKIVKSNFTLFSPSGDWAQYVYHYFRPDGTLAKASSELRTFNGNLIVLQDFYVDRRGRLLKKTIKYLDLQTNKPKKPEEPSETLDDADYYRKTDKLPFAHLLGKKK